MAWEMKLFAWADATFGNTVDLYRGLVPRSVAIVEFALESGFDRYMLASDKPLAEMGDAGVEQRRYLEHDCDPCDDEASIWLGCHDLIEDAVRYIGMVGEADLADIWYLMFLDFSIGTGAVKHIIKVVQTLDPRKNVPLRDRIVAWSRTKNFNAPHHAAHWGRQGPALVQKRITKQLQRLEWAQALGAVVGAGYRQGIVPPSERPDLEPAFPDGLRPIAEKKAKLPLTDTAGHAALYAETKAYLRRRRKLDAKWLPWKIRLARWLAARDEKHPEAHGRGLDTVA